MNAPKTPSKKKPMTEKQVAQIMTKRRACIQKFRETIKKTIKTSKKKSTEPVVPSLPVKKNRVSKKKSTEPVVPSVPSEPAVPLEVDIPPKKKRVYKKKSREPTVPSEPAVPIEQVIEEK